MLLLTCPTGQDKSFFLRQKQRRKEPVLRILSVLIFPWSDAFITILLYPSPRKEERERKDRREIKTDTLLLSPSEAKEEKALDNFSAFPLSLSFFFLLGLSHESARLLVPCPRRKTEERWTKEKLARLLLDRSIGCGSDLRGGGGNESFEHSASSSGSLSLSLSSLLMTCPLGQVIRKLSSPCEHVTQSSTQKNVTSAVCQSRNRPSRRCARFSSARSVAARCLLRALLLLDAAVCFRC